ncbi:MAG TPA: hypothetical protein VHL52_08775 [Acidimicrobiia bacterium]|nr:hypothetical protein [Acidimicrobiia bacterium]
MAVAVDTQGGEAPARFARQVEGAFPVLVDAEGLLAQTFGFRAIPNGLLVGPDGVVDAVVAGGFDVRRAETRSLIDEWLDGQSIPLFEPDESSWSPEVRRLFHGAVEALRRKDRPEAIKLLATAFSLERDNYIIRKQLWAIEHPERFYDGAIDRDWQRQQLEQGR